MNLNSPPGRANLSQLPTQDLQLNDIWKFVLRRRYLILAGSILGAIVGLILYVRSPRLYTSTATVEMNRDATSGLGLQDLSGVGSSLGIGQDFMTDMLTQQAVLLNETTALYVIDHLNLMTTSPYSALNSNVRGEMQTQNSGMSVERSTIIRDKALALFSSKLRVSPVKNTRLLTVSYTDQDPVRAAQVANAVVEAYLTNHTRARYEATSKASTWLNEQLAGLKQQAEDTQKQIVALEKRGGVASVPLASGSRSAELPQESTLANPDVAQLMALNQDLSRAELARIQQGAIYRLTQTSDPNVLLDFNATKLALGEGSALAANGQSMELIQSLRNQEASLKLRLAAAKATYGAKSPVIIELQNQTDSVHTQLAEEMSRLRSQAKTNYELAQANEDTLRKQVELHKEKVLAVGNTLAELAFLREEEGTSRKLYQDLYTRLQEAAIAAGVRSSGMTVVSPALPPSRHSAPRLRNHVGAGFIAGLFLGVLAGMILQICDATINIPEEFEAISPHPLLGVIPGFESGNGAGRGKALAEPEGIQDRAWILQSPKSRLAEAYRQIRTSILLSSVDHPPKVLLFTSPMGGDGKSVTSYNMAAAFAAQSAKVLLIEADMRRSSLGELTGLQAPTGLSDVLSSTKAFDEVVQVNPHFPTLSILLAGRVPPDPSELLGSNRFTNLIGELRERFDYILIDAPPVLLVTDPVVAATVSDAVIAVLRAGKTTRPALRRFWTMLNKIDVLGFVVNDFNSRLQSYGYGYEAAGYYSDAAGYYSEKEKR